MEQLSGLLGELSLTPDRLAVLEQLQPALSRLSRQELATGLAAGGVDLVPIFDCLNSGEPGLERTGCEVLARLLGAMDPGIVLERYCALMTRGLEHPATRVQTLVIGQLARCAQDDELAGQVTKRSLLSPCLALLAGELEAAEAVTGLAVALAETPPGLAALAAPPVPKQLAELGGRGSVVQLRVLELAVRVAVLGEEQLAAVAGAGLLAPLQDLLQTEDCLAALAAVELLSTLALPPHGHRWLEDRGLVGRMARLLEDGQNHPLAAILVPGIVKFFGNLAHSRPRQVLVQHPAFVCSLAAMAEAEDPVTQSLALETIGYIGASLEGKLALAELGNKMTNCIDRLEDLITDSPAEARIRAMHAFSSLIRLDKEHQTPELTSLTESWFRRVPSAPGRLAELAKQPFPDLRLAALELLLVVAGQAWGRRAVAACPGLPEALMDRRMEQEAEGKQARWRVVAALVEGAEVREVLGPQMELQLKEHARQGPFYVQVQAQVATEGDD